MHGAAAHEIWCHTCGRYIRPGTHGIHEMRYGGGARGDPAATQNVSGAHAVVLVVMLLAGFAFAVLLIGFLIARAAR